MRIDIYKVFKSFSIRYKQKSIHRHNFYVASWWKRKSISGVDDKGGSFNDELYRRFVEIQNDLSFFEDDKKLLSKPIIGEKYNFKENGKFKF